MISVLVFLIAGLPAAAQKKEPPSNVKNQFRPEGDDPWANYKEEKDSINRWAAGITFGGYFPNTYPGNYYNGSPVNINNFDYVHNNTTWRREIYLALGSPDTLITDNNGSYNTNLKYQVAITAGIFLRYHLNRKNGLFIEANYVQLKASSSISVKYVKYQEQFEQFLQLPVVGKEERAMLTLGYHRSFPMKSKICFYIDGGITMCYTHVMKSAVVVEGQEYNMIDIYGGVAYAPNSNVQSFNTVQYGIGFGGLLGAGVTMPLTDKFGLEPGVGMQYYPVNLARYPDFKPNFTIYLRIMLGFSHSKVA